MPLELKTKSLPGDATDMASIQILPPDPPPAPDIAEPLLPL